MLKTVKEANLRGKKVLMRCGFDVPLDENGEIEDDTRVQDALPSIKYILEQQPESLIIISHLDRPGGAEVEELKNEKVAEKLKELLAISNQQSAISKIETNIGIPAYQIGDKIQLLENIRFYPEEEENDPEFAKKLASFGDIFVFDAFSAAHREHASTLGIMDHLDSYAGFGVQNEIENLSELLEDPAKPFVVIIGGAKVEDKGPVIENLKELADKILVGGKTSNILHKEKKYQDTDTVILHLDGLDKDKNIVYPEDDPLATYDIGPKTVAEFSGEAATAKTILIAGPLGKFEKEPYKKGTEEVYRAVAESAARKFACGGDTIEVIDEMGISSRFDFISTGGGAALEYLAKGRLPVIEKLKTKI